MKRLTSIAAFLDRHPMFAAFLLVLLFGIMGVMDRNSEERTMAYRQGLIDAQGNVPSERDQLKNICSQPWPDIKGGAEARARVCPKE